MTTLKRFLLIGGAALLIASLFLHLGSTPIIIAGVSLVSAVILSGIDRKRRIEEEARNAYDDFLNALAGLLESGWEVKMGLSILGEKVTKPDLGLVPSVGAQLNLDYPAPCLSPVRAVAALMLSREDNRVPGTFQLAKKLGLDSEMAFALEQAELGVEGSVRADLERVLKLAV